MFTYMILGITFGFAAAVQPGPLSTYLISQTLSNGWKRTIPATLSPLISDGPIALLALFVLSRVPPDMIQWLRFFGGIFVLYLAFGAWKSWKKFDEKAIPENKSGIHSIREATIVNFLNPSPYLGWSLVIGPLLLKGWRESPVNGIALLSGFYITMILSLCGIIFLFFLARNIGPKVNKWLVGLSALALACFGIYQIWMGFAG